MMAQEALDAPWRPTTFPSMPRVSDGWRLSSAAHDWFNQGGWLHLASFYDKNDQMFIVIELGMSLLNMMNN